MDPTQTLADMLAALDDAKLNKGRARDSMIEDAKEDLQDLFEWLDNDGFAPNVPEAIRRSNVDMTDVQENR